MKSYPLNKYLTPDACRHTYDGRLESFVFLTPGGHRYIISEETARKLGKLKADALDFFNPSWSAEFRYVNIASIIVATCDKA